MRVLVIEGLKLVTDALYEGEAPEEAEMVVEDINGVLTDWGGSPQLILDPRNIQAKYEEVEDEEA